MSREPTEDDVTLALRLGTSDLKRDMAEAQRDLKHFLNQWIKEVEQAGEASRRAVAGERGIKETVRLGGTVTAQQRAGVKDARAEVEVFKARAKWQEVYIKTMQQQIANYKVQHKHLREINANLKQGLFTAKEHAKSIKSITSAEKQLEKQIDKRVKKEEKATKAKNKQAADESRGFIGRIKEQMRMYTVMSSRGVRMISTMRGGAGAALGALAVAGQLFAQQIITGLKAIKQYEGVARRIAFLQAGQQGIGIGEAYTAARTDWLGSQGAMTGPGAGTEWGQLGIPRLEGASLEILRLQSGLEFTDKQLQDIAVGAEFIGEESSEFFANLINYVRLFNIETEEFDDAISMFLMMSSRTMGGSGALGGEMGSIAAMAQGAGWDWREILMIQEEVKESGKSTTKFWRQYGNVLSKVIEDDTMLDQGIRDINNDLIELDDIMAIILHTMDRFETTGEAARWAIENFGDEGWEAIQVTANFREGMEDWIRLEEEAAGLQEEANLALGGMSDIWDDSLEKNLNALDDAILEFQMALASIIAGPLAEMLSWGAGFLSEGAENLARGGRQLAGQTTIADELWAWERKQTATVAWEKRPGYGTGIDFFADILHGKGKDWEEHSERTKWFDQGEEEGDAAYYSRLLNQWCVENPGHEWCTDVTIDFSNVAPQFDVPETSQYYIPYSNDNCGRAYGNPDYGKPCEEEQSPALRYGMPQAGSITNKRTQSSSSVVHNYITVMDNDSLLRDLLGVNVNV